MINEGHKNAVERKRKRVSRSLASYVHLSLAAVTISRLEKSNQAPLLQEMRLSNPNYGISFGGKEGKSNGGPWSLDPMFQIDEKLLGLCTFPGSYAYSKPAQYVILASHGRSITRNLIPTNRDMILKSFFPLSQV